jgi:light-regulated signal transduction histidine kinase (bacteriophytochrome)
VIAGKLERYDLEFRVGSGNRWVKASATPVRDGKGAVVRVIGAVQEITDVVQARATMVERRTELERLVDERTASLQRAIEQMEEFSYSVSHDLRAPLRSIQNYAQAVIEDFGDKVGAEGVEYLRRIVNAGFRMDRLTRDVLTYSKVARGSAPVVPLSLDRVVEETIEQYAPARQRDGSVTVQGPLLPALANEPLLVQAISNLLANAFKFVAKGTTPNVRLWTERRGPDVRLWIEDNGIGILPEYQHRIWGMFERVHPKETYDGTGIGLAITRKAAERMGGAVGVESAGVNGSRFWIQLRAAETGVPPL